MYMLDTNICIYAIKHRPEMVLQKIRENLPAGICISVITLAELRHGVEKSLYKEKNEAALLKFLSILDVLPFDDYAAIEYGKICSTLQKQGMPIGAMDMLIAAHAKANHMVLITNNTREFERVPELSIDDWVN